MAHHLHRFMASLLALAALLQANEALEFDVFNKVPSTPGGVQFDKEIGIPFTKRLMEKQQNSYGTCWRQMARRIGRTDVEVVHMVIDNYDGYVAITYIGACTTNVSAVFLNGDYGDNIKWSFTSLIYHEMTHIWQWYPPMTPTGLIEDIADYTALKAKYYKPEFFARPGSGKRWDQGYSITARFLEYCDGLKPGFVAAMNRKMRDTWSLNYFVELV
ncbi:hypothetical protein HYC85_009744 [Camellia sinensis]|uniref:Uncharacterized protein n=1 Tax=Camellia sinensis TaxID=4442 RepID=A0A7J7HFW6_CAMSI|nr:hypothetical protein HYC85_009744 [Camellia sinensis]